VLYSVSRHFDSKIETIINETSSILKVPESDLHTSFNEYNKDKSDIPYIKLIVENSTFTKEDFERSFNKKYRQRYQVIEDFWKKTLEEKLLPLKYEVSIYEKE